MPADDSMISKLNLLFYFINGRFRNTYKTPWVIHGTKLSHRVHKEFGFSAA